MDQLTFLTSWLSAHSDGFETLMFYGLATLAIPFAYGVIFDKAVIRSGFLLIGVFGAISGLFLLLQAQFIAMAQIMIYAVGITLVVVVALMLTNPKSEDELSPGVNPHSFNAGFAALLLFITIYMGIVSEGWSPATTPVDQANNIINIGTALTTDYSLPFEFASVLLLAALMGSVMLAKAERRQDSNEYPDGTGSDDAEPKKPREVVSTR